MKDNISDAELIQRCINDHDRDAWEVFVKRYSRLIWNFIRRTFNSYFFSFSPEDTEDLYGSILLSLLDNDMKKLRQYNNEYSCSVSTWLTTITVRTTIDYMRRDRSRLYVEPVLEDREIWDTIADSRYMSDEYAENRQKSRLLGKALETLPVTDRRIYDSLYRMGLSPEDTAKLLGMSVSSIYTRKHRIVEKIKKYIEGL